MNPYQNENEIVNVVPSNINASNMYPFTKNPNVKMFDEISPSSIGLGTLLGLFLDYKSLLGSPSITGGIGFLQSIIGIIAGANVATVTIDDVQRLINQSLDTYTRQQAESRMNSITNDYNQYLLNLRDYINGRTNRNNFVQSLRMNEQRLRNELDSFFSLRGRELLLLPNFVQVALLHLAILRDAVVHGGPDLERPFVSETAQTSFLTRPPSSSFQEALSTSIRIYSNYCTQEYHNGLTQMRNRGNSGRDWLNFHAYRRELTLSVLDFVSIFPFFDPILYHITRNFSLPINSQLSRVIYTNPAGFLNANGREGWYAPRHNNTVTFSSIESNIPGPTTSRFLQNIDIFTNGLGVGANPNRTQSWQGNINSNFNGTRDHSGLTNGQPRGISGQNIFRVISIVHTLDLRSFGVSGADFLHTTGQTFQYRVPQFPPSGIGVHHGPISQFLPGKRSNIPTANDYTHLLSRVANITAGLQPVVQGQRNSVVIHGWTHRSLTRENIIVPNSITQIPAVKTSFYSNCTVVSGPGSTGGDLVKLNANGRFDIQVQLQTPQTNYRIRLRYAAVSTSSINITFSGAAHPSTLPSTTSSLNNLQYEHFGYLNVVGTFIPSLGNMLSIINTSSNSNVVIDKIEFIPVGTFANHSLEATQEYNNNYPKHANSTYNQSYNNYDQNMENTYQPSYVNGYEQNYYDHYDSGYNDTCNQNMVNTYDQEYNNYNQNSNDMYKQEYANNYNQNSGCTCKQCYNQNSPK
ncbi:insecticidal delta-endotoxin Cry8Ea1 family protein [Bacillus cereus]